MASSSVSQNSLHHFRSNSLPTRANPLISEFSDHLSKLRCSEATSSSSTSLSQKLICIQDLHDCVDKLLLLPCTQALAQEQHEKWKVVKKAVQKVLKGMQTNLNSKKNEGLGMVSMLKELEALTLMVFELLLTFISGPKLQSKSSSWFVVSKLVHPKRIACEGEETDVNEFEKVDVVLQSLISHKTSKSNYSIHIQNVQNWMEQLESSIQDFEEVLESLSKRLVKTRVSFLNILNH
ncbi:uncharacterized protein LOC126721355 [Quercus robur]|uniref:uncharacterized protein LOC126721355 n=1 Tax=Quercus robur TaxID=38942 RepID=UPI00216144A1|nr:uncharacterized protein LOC126721355 [Quercus robur]